MGAEKRWRALRVGVSFATGAAFATFSSSGVAQTTIGVESSRTSTDDPSVLLSQLDNPIVVGSYPLRAAVTGPMITQVPRPIAWEFFRHDLYTSLACDIADPFCVENPDFGVGSTTAPVGPSFANAEAPFERFAPAAFEYEVRGMRVGRAPADVRLRELVETSATTTATQQAAAIRVALDPATLLVPVNVVVALPSPSFPGPRAIMAPLAREDLYRTLFDDRHYADHLRAPDGIYEGHWNWTLSSVREQPPSNTLDFRVVQSVVAGGDVVSAYTFDEIGLQPDSVFVQCGIQFRMAEFAVFDESDATRVWMTSDGTPFGPPLCAMGAELTLRGKLRTLRTQAAATFADPSLPLVIFGYRASNPDCFGGFLQGVAEPRDYAFLSIGNNRRDNTNTLVHELGHVLGMDHTLDDPECGNATSTNIMCAAPRPLARHIPGCEMRNGQLLSPVPRNCTPQGDSFARASCDLARSVAGSLTDSSPPLLELGPDQTVECTSTAGAAVTVNAVASDPQSGITAINYSPQPTTVSGAEGETATFAVPVGMPLVVTARAFNGASQNTTDTVTLTVRDSVPPAIAPVPPVAITMCNADQSVTLTAPVVTDVCSAGLLASGRVVEQDGVTLPVPIPLSNGNVTLAAGVYVVEWQATDAAGNAATPARQTVSIAACVGAAGAMKIADRARLETASGRPLQIVNDGTGVLEVGVEARVGSIASKGPILLRDRAVVDGSIRTTGTLTRSATATVTGSVFTGVPVVLPAPPSIGNPWPATSSPGFSVEPSMTRSITAGSYGPVSVKSSATLLLSGGTYYFATLALEPHARVRVRANTVIEVKSAYIHRGAYVNDSGVLTQATLRYRGTSGVFLESSFLGAALVPNADLVLGGIAGARYEGTFFGKNLELRPDVPIVVPATISVSLPPSEPTGNAEEEPVRLDGSLAKGSPRIDDASRAETEVAAISDAQGCTVSAGRITSGNWWTLGALAGAAVLRIRRRRSARACAARSAV